MPPQVLAKLNTWVAGLDKNDPRYEHHLLEGLWVSWGMNKVDQKLLRQVLKAKDYHARAAAVQVVRYTGHQVADQADLLMQAVQDDNSRVRLDAIVAASWIGKEKGLPILAEAAKKPLDDWMIHAHETAVAHLNGVNVKKVEEKVVKSTLKGEELALVQHGQTNLCQRRVLRHLPPARWQRTYGLRFPTAHRYQLGIGQ